MRRNEIDLSTMATTGRTPDLSLHPNSGDFINAETGELIEDFDAPVCISGGKYQLVVADGTKYKFIPVFFALDEESVDTITGVSAPQKNKVTIKANHYRRDCKALGICYSSHPFLKLQEVDEFMARKDTQTNTAKVASSRTLKRTNEYQLSKEFKTKKARRKENELDSSHSSQHAPSAPQDLPNISDVATQMMRPTPQSTLQLPSIGSTLNGSPIFSLQLPPLQQVTSEFTSATSDALSNSYITYYLPQDLNEKEVSAKPAANEKYQVRVSGKHPDPNTHPNVGDFINKRTGEIITAYSEPVCSTGKTYYLYDPKMGLILVRYALHDKNSFVDTETGVQAQNNGNYSIKAGSYRAECDRFGIPYSSHPILTLPPNTPKEKVKEVLIDFRNQQMSTVAPANIPRTVGNPLAFWERSNQEKEIVENDFDLPQKDANDFFA